MINVMNPGQSITRSFGRWFVPHKHNDHRPSLIRAHGLSLALVAIIVVQFLGHTVRSADVRVLDYATDITPQELLDQTNQQRAANGLGALRLNAKLNESAMLKAQDMFANNYWAHVSPTGVQPWYWFGVAGYRYQYAGENLAEGFDTTSATMDAWMNSAGHRANILGVHYVDVGFAVLNGTLQGSQVTLVVAHYGAPVAVAPPPAPAPAAAPAPAPAPAPVRVVPPPAAAPAPTAVPTPELTPIPTITPRVTPIPTLAPPLSPTPFVVSGQIVEAAPPVQKRYVPVEPLAAVRTLTWPNLVTALILLLLMLVYGFTHFTVWRKQLRRWRQPRYRFMVVVQLGGLLLLLVWLFNSGLGRVG